MKSMRFSNWRPAQRVRSAWPLMAACALLCAACDLAPRRIELPALPTRATPDAGRPTFACKTETSRGCLGEVYSQCQPHGEFLEVVETDCAAMGRVCDPDRMCITCRAGTPRCRDCTGQGNDCNPNIVEACNADGNGYSEVVECGADHKPEVCFQGSCTDACTLAQSQSSYAGCEFYAADLDNAAIDDMNNASAQQYAVVVANPQRVPIEVRVEKNNAPYGQALQTEEVDKKVVPPGDLEVFKLDRREVDGSSQFGINDGTHSALTSNAYRIVSNYPIAAYQFNPLENVNVFSNDASLLLPVPALGADYSVVGWPQTIGNSDNPEQDFDRTSSKEDLRAFLTIIGVAKDTTLSVDLGSKVVQMVGAPNIPAGKPGDTFSVNIGPFDVVNLETQGFNADFTGTHLHASNPIAVFVGSEASDVPMFGTYATRQCCADHLEEQLLPDRSAGTHFVVGRMPNRTRALNNAALPNAPLGVAEVDEPEWIRLVTTTSGRTRVHTTLDPPDDDFTLESRGDVILRANRDFIIEADQPIHVLEALASQGVTGIPRQYPGGDPSIITIPPVDQFRRDYIFLTPDKYAFDFVTIVAPPDANIQLDGAPLPAACAGTPADGVARSAKDPTPEWVVHRCQLSFPEVTNGTGSGGLMGGSAPSVVHVLLGEQHDGAHTVVSDQPVSIVVYGFDRFVSYAYVGGLNLNALN
jgi:hypothetical protein